MTAKEIEVAAINLPRRARARLARKLLDTIPIRTDERDQKVLSAWIAEVERRIDEFETGKVNGIPANLVFKRLRAPQHR